MNNTSDFEHALKNYLGIILGFSELLLHESSPDDPHRTDLEEIHKAAVAAVKLIEGMEPHAGMERGS